MTSGLIASDPGARNVGDRLLSWSKVKEITGLSRTTAWRRQRAGDFPPPVQISPGRVGWWESELTAWKSSRAPKGASHLPAFRPAAATSGDPSLTPTKADKPLPVARPAEFLLATKPGLIPRSSQPTRLPDQTSQPVPVGAGFIDGNTPQPKALMTTIKSRKRHDCAGQTAFEF